MTQQLFRVNSLAEITELQPTYLALGSFDGVHLGHQTVIRDMVDEARMAGMRSAVLTFFPHPKRVISGDRGRFYINTIEDRVRLLASVGPDLVITQTFDTNVRNTSATDFVDQLVKYVGLRQIWGGNFAFGYQREGNIDFLRREGAERGFEVRAVEALLTFDGSLISSSRVRQSLNEGDFQDVNGCLARRHSLSGVVVKGDQRGRSIGFPTANLAVWEELLLPANGVYGTYAWVGDRRYAAAANVGIRPTVNGRDRTVEAYLLDFDEDIYGQTLRLEFDMRIRPEKRFSSLDALREQIQKDVDQVRESLIEGWDSA
jgi:riboflavin kinase/FMN adenylyltransferase